MTHQNLLIKPSSGQGQPLINITPESAGWKHLSFQVWNLSAGETWSHDTGDAEFVLVDLGGQFDVATNRGEWLGIGTRANVFTGPAHTLYLPPLTKLTDTAGTNCKFAVGWCAAAPGCTPFLIKPDQVQISLRGGGPAHRQINDLIPPGSPVRRLVVVEVYTPGGMWSSYPPHKHDRHKFDLAGQEIEAELEEIYFYQFERPEGYALQWIYTDEDSSDRWRASPLDQVVRPQHDDAVLVPAGYHPVACPPGYLGYYLNILAGSSQSLANSDDPRFSWTKERLADLTTRLPLY